MAEIRLSKLTKQFNIGLQTLVDFLKEKGAEVEMNPNAKISDSYLPAIETKFGEEQKLKQDSEKVAIKLKEIIEMGTKKKMPEDDAETQVKEVIIKSNLSSEAHASQPAANTAETAPAVQETPEADTAKTEPEHAKEIPEEKPAGGLKIVGEIDLSQFEKKPKTKDNKPAEAEKPKPEKVEEEKKEAKEESAAEVPAAAPDAADKPEVKNDEPSEPRREIREIKIEVEKLQGPKIVDKIDLSQFDRKKNKKRERIAKGGSQKVDVTKMGDEADNQAKKDRKKGKGNDAFRKSDRDSGGSGKGGKKRDRFKPMSGRGRGYAEGNPEADQGDLCKDERDQEQDQPRSETQKGKEGAGIAEDAGRERDEGDGQEGSQGDGIRDRERPCHPYEQYSGDKSHCSMHESRTYGIHKPEVGCGSSRIGSGRVRL